MSARKQETGFTLVELAIVLGIAASAAIVYLSFMESRAQIGTAQALGKRVAEYTRAVGRYVEEVRIRLPLGTNDIYEDSLWLKDNATCPGGTSATRYLPCAWQDTLPYGITSSTVVTNVEGVITATTTFEPTIRLSGQLRLDLIHTARNSAEQGSAGRLSVGQAYRVTEGNLLESIVTTVFNDDPWLRLDGSRPMEGDLDMDGKDIRNGNNITAAGRIAANRLTSTATITAGGDVTAPDVVLRDLGNKEMSTGVYDVVGVCAGGVVSKPTCPVGKSPQIHLFPFQYSANNLPVPMGAVQAWATDNGTNWTANFRVLTPPPTGWVTPDCRHGIMTAISKCG